MNSANEKNQSLAPVSFDSKLIAMQIIPCQPVAD